MAFAKSPSDSTMKDTVAIARAACDAYVTKNRAALEALIADDFHFSSSLDNRLDRNAYFARCWLNRKPSKALTSTIWCRMVSASSLPMRQVARVTTASATPKSSPFAAPKSWRYKSISVGTCRIRQQSVALLPKRDCDFPPSRCVPRRTCNAPQCR